MLCKMCNQNEAEFKLHCEDSSIDVCGDCAHTWMDGTEGVAIDAESLVEKERSMKIDVVFPFQSYQDWLYVDGLLSRLKASTDTIDGLFQLTEMKFTLVTKSDVVTFSKEASNILAGLKDKDAIDRAYLSVRFLNDDKD